MSYEAENLSRVMRQNVYTPLALFHAGRPGRALCAPARVRPAPGGRGRAGRTRLRLFLAHARGERLVRAGGGPAAARAGAGVARRVRDPLARARRGRRRLRRRRVAAVAVRQHDEPANYGWFGTVEFRAPEFNAAYGALTRPIAGPDLKQGADHAPDARGRLRTLARLREAAAAPRGRGCGTLARADSVSRRRPADPRRLDDVGAARRRARGRPRPRCRGGDALLPAGCRRDERGVRRRPRARTSAPERLPAALGSQPGQAAVRRDGDLCLVLFSLPQLLGLLAGQRGRLRRSQAVPQPGRHAAEPRAALARTAHARAGSPRRVAAGPPAAHRPGARAGDSAGSDRCSCWSASCAPSRARSSGGFPSPSDSRVRCSSRAWPTSPSTFSSRSRRSTT